MTRTISSPRATACGISIGAPMSSAMRSVIVLLPLPGAPKMNSDARETIAPPIWSMMCCSSSSSPNAFLSWASATGARDRVVHLDRVGPAFQPRIIRHATGVHELVLLELVDQGGEGFEGETKALFERRAGQLIGEGERPEQQAGDQITTDVQVFQ